MLRIKKYNSKKKKSFNKFFKRHYDYDDINYCELNNIIIKKGENFNIIKEYLLETYILCFKNIIIIHLEENQYKDFIYLYKNSSEYSFEIYRKIILCIIYFVQINIYMKLIILIF